jgi:hypothetical protein
MLKLKLVWHDLKKNPNDLPQEGFVKAVICDQEWCKFAYLDTKYMFGNHEPYKVWIEQSQGTHGVVNVRKWADYN